ncbi:mechanosensitive ion channel family protein [Romeriopsis navalis]|nr:mechanosensitive ion channel family protein [Romeriopsis navalis]
MFSSSWLTWSIILVVALPLGLILLGELRLRLHRRGSPFAPSVQALRNRLLPLLAAFLFLNHVLQLVPENLLVKLTGTLLWIGAIDVVLSFVNVLIFEGQKGATWRKQVPKLLIELCRLVLVLLGIGFVLSQVWGADLAGLAAALGVSSIVLGLALQDTLGSIMSGIALLFERPFNVGDWIKVEKVEGHVLDINWRAVRLLTRDHEVLTIPHKVMGSGIICNYSQPDRRHVQMFEIDFASEDPPNLIKQVILKTALSTEGILNKPEPMIWAKEYNDYRAVYIVKYWISDYQYAPPIMDRLKTRIWYASQRSGLKETIPIHRLVKLDNLPGEAGVSPDAFTESLKTNPVFLPAVKHSNLAQLSTGITLHSYGVGEPVFEEGEVPGFLYMIITGSVLLTIRDASDQPREVARLSNGDFFGEMALFSDEPSPFAVKVVDDLQIIALSADLVNQMIENTPSLAREIGQIIDKRRRRIAEVQKQYAAATTRVS